MRGRRRLSRGALARLTTAPARRTRGARHDHGTRPRTRRPDLVTPVAAPGGGRGAPSTVPA
ncbi:hypothetical protein KRH_09460 [Kocuria rhizophila DC2201]|uniref:Uncharacterized protein n=1 Tax=Kocuria rhizophila (strain ATCC 9341 / DSM 348 / NBRC 103217 / DC2201) TaxID=378753 RepID=B2GLV2_KOCRD|nr:hypothetical protein KRH_09460 [Kocuria rhizophila DC2201]